MHTMERASLSLHACLLLALHALCVLGNACYEEKEQCCKKCKAGYHLAGVCGPCLPCPPDGYTDRPNNYANCLACHKCEGIFRYKETCSSTKNAVCECVPGKHCTNARCTQCRTNLCPAGQEFRAGRCETCLRGTFNNGTAGICKPWTNCSVVLVNGTNMSDVVCGGHRLTKRTTTSAAAVTSTAYEPEEVIYAPINKDVTIIVIASTCFIVLCLVAFGLFLSGNFLEKLKNNFKKIPVVKQTEQEDACSYHYPEEEHGEEEPMTGEP